LKKVYFISGLGADKRVFSFLDLSFCEPVFIDWISPLKNESLKNYALRIKEQIKDHNPVIVGLSFGGMLATEIAKYDRSVKAIIISSNKLSKELPGYFRLGKYLPFYKLVPSFLIKPTAILFKSLFGAGGKEQQKIFRQIITDTDPHFVKWAMHAMLTWNNNIKPENLTHIHGTTDKLLPYRLVNANYTIKEGTHLMIIDKHKEISALLHNLVV